MKKSEIPPYKEKLQVILVVLVINIRYGVAGVVLGWKIFWMLRERLFCVAAGRVGHTGPRDDGDGVARGRH